MTASPFLARIATALARVLIAAGGATALLGGCVTGSTYDGPEPPEEDIAVLEGYWHFYFVAVRIVKITKVDGKPVRAASGDVTRVKLSPGWHSIGLSVLSAFGEVGVSAHCTFEAQFEKGHRYRVESFDASASETEIGLEVKTTFRDSLTTRSIPCRRVDH